MSIPSDQPVPGDRILRLLGRGGMATVYLAVQESLGASIPFPSRLGQPGEFADTVAFIIGNRYLNGETIRLDGGVRLAPK